MLEIIIWIVFGGIIGWIASLIMRNDESQGLVGNVIVGVGGALLGGFVARQLFGLDIEGFNVTSFVVSLFGAVILIALTRLLFGTR